MSDTLLGAFSTHTHVNCKLSQVRVQDTRADEKLISSNLKRDSI